jgi:hypothetical protein
MLIHHSIYYPYAFFAPDEIDFDDEADDDI